MFFALFHDNFMRFRQSTHLTNYSNLRFYIAVSRNNTDTPTTTLRYIVKLSMIEQLSLSLPKPSIGLAS